MGCISSGEDDRLDAIFDTLEHELAYRKEQFAKAGCNSYEEYKQSNTDCPTIIVVLENYAKFRELAYTFEERLIDIVSSGRTYGFSFVVTTNSKSGIYHKVREHLSKVICFGMLDAEAYRDILGVRIEVEPENVKGRALILHHQEAVELQIALPVKHELESERSQTMKEFLQKHLVESREKPIKGDRKEAEQTVVDTPSEQKADHNLYTVSEQSATSIVVGYDAKKHRPLYVDYSTHTRIFVCSDVIEDFSTLYSKLLFEAEDKPIWYLNGTENDRFEQILNEIEACALSSSQPLVIIPDFVQLYKDISDENLDILVGFVKKAINTTFITCSRVQELSMYRDTALYILLCKRASVTMFTGKTVSEKVTVLLNDNFSQIDRKILGKQNCSMRNIITIDSAYAETYFREVN